MAATITSDVGTFTATYRLSATETIESRNVVHELLGGGVAVTFGGAAQQTTDLEFMFTTEADALDAFTQLNTGHVFQLTDSDKTSTSGYFSIAGEISREYQTETADVWLVSAAVQFVTP